MDETAPKAPRSEEPASNKIDESPSHPLPENKESGASHSPPSHASAVSAASEDCLQGRVRSILFRALANPLPELIYPHSLEETEGFDVYERRLLFGLLSKRTEKDIDELFREFMDKNPVTSPYFTVLKAYVLGLVGTAPDGLLCFRELIKDSVSDGHSIQKALKAAQRETASQKTQLEALLISIRRQSPHNSALLDDIKSRIEQKDRDIQETGEAITLYKERIKISAHNLEITHPLQELLEASRKALVGFKKGTMKRGAYLKEQERREKQRVKNLLQKLKIA